MIGVKFFAVMARFPDPPVTEAWAFQVSAPANRSAAVAASTNMSLRIGFSLSFYRVRRGKVFTRLAAKATGSNAAGARRIGHALPALLAEQKPQDRDWV
jgi:hypothetical protein